MFPLCRPPFASASAASALLFVLLSTGSLQASSKIWDYVIEEDGGSAVRVRLEYAPYSSIQGLLNAMTYKDGSYQTAWLTHSELGMLTTSSKKGAWYIDETPVPYEAVRPFLVEGQRLASFENRSLFYFTQVPARNQESKLGFVNTVGDDFIIIERHQTNTSDWGETHYTDGSGLPLALSRDGTIVSFSFDDFPNRERTVAIEPTAVVKIDGATYPWKGWVQPETVDLHTRPGLAAGNQVIVQAARKMRVELDLPDWGKWSEFVNDRAVDPVGGEQRQLQGNFYGVMMASETAVRNIQTAPYPWPDFPRFEDVPTFPAWLLNGGPEEPGGPIYRPIYENNPHVVIDGFFVGQQTIWQRWLEKGRHYVAATRRTRAAIGSFLMSSENPVAFGEITAINGNEVTLSAPLISDPEHGTVAVSGVQVITLDADAEYFHLGARILKDGVLKVGQLIKVWAPRPQTIVYNKALGTNPVNVQASGDMEEGGGDISFTITRAGDASGAISVPVAFSGDAVAADYTVAGVTGYDSGTNTGTVELADGVSQVQVTVTPASDASAEGSEAVTLTLQSSAGYVLINAADTANILDTETDYAPVITLIAPETVSATHGLHPAAMQLEVTATDDNNTAITYQWIEVSGPGTVTFGDDTSAVTSATFSTDGEYVVRLTATDAGLNSSSLDLAVSVLPANSAPTADIFYWDNVFTAGPSRVLLSAHAASDADDDEMTYVWDFGDGSSLTGRRVYHTFDPGIYNVTLTVADGRGGVDQAQIPVVVDPDPSLIIWEETFDEWSDGTTSDAGLTPWNASGNNMSVQSGKLQSFDSIATWTSGAIDISDGEAMVLLDLSSDGNLENSDTTTISYRVDGGSWVDHGVLSEQELEDLDGKGALESVAIPSLIGSRVEIRVRIQTSSTNEIVRLDDVRVYITSGEPRISVSAAGTANEWAPQGVDFVIDRILNTTDTFIANFSLGGTSVGADYNVTGATSWNAGSRTGTIQFNGGEAQKTITVTPINDSVTEGTETMQMTLQTGTGYSLGTTTAQADILDAQTNYAPFITLVSPTEGSLSLASENETANLEITAMDDRSATLTYQWSKVSGPGTVTFGSETSASTTADFSTFGEYVIRVTVTDGDDIDATQDYAVTVIDSLNNAPTAVISSDVVAGSAPLTVSFDGTGSTDPDLDTLTYSWNFGDGGSSTDASPTHTFTTQGVYNVQLTVNDSRTGSDSESVVINVGTPAAPGNIIWQETFADLSNGATEDTGSTAWTLNNTNGALSVQDGEMQGSNLDATFTWTSEVVDISSGTANIAVDLKSPPSDQLEIGQDFVRVGYRLDGGSLVVAQTYDGPIDDDWVTFVQTGLTGSSLEVVVQVNNTSGAEKYFFDNVTVRVEPSGGAGAGYNQAWKDSVFASHSSGSTGAHTDFGARGNGFMTNGLIYAFGIDSLDPADAIGKLPSLQIAEVGNNQHLELEFRRRVGGAGALNHVDGYVADGVRYIVQCSSNMLNWETGDALLEVIGSPVDNSDGTETVRVRVLQSLTTDPEGREFMRLNIQQILP